jgi:hypothetical protein
MGGIMGAARGFSRSFVDLCVRRPAVALVAVGWAVFGRYFAPSAPQPAPSKEDDADAASAVSVRILPFLFVFAIFCCGYICTQGTRAFGVEIKPGDKVVTLDVCPVMSGQDVKAQVPRGTELTARSVNGPWVAVEWSQYGEKITGWIRGSSVMRKDDAAGRIGTSQSLDDYPRAKQLTSFRVYPQQSGNTCSAAAARNLLGRVSGHVPSEWALFQEIVQEDHKGLAHLEEKLKRIGIYDPRALSSYGGTPVGTKAAINRRLPRGLKCDFKEIPKLEDRILLIVRSINNGWPVIVPLVSSTLNHWITVTGYDRDARYFSTASFGTLSFDRFDALNSWKSTPGGQLGKAFQLANEEHMGRWVLVYITNE